MFFVVNVMVHAYCWGSGGDGRAGNDDGSGDDGMGYDGGGSDNDSSDGSVGCWEGLEMLMFKLWLNYEYLDSVPRTIGVLSRWAHF